MDKPAGRRKEYSEAGIRRLKCVFCGCQAQTQWQACADGRMHRPICALCDVALNAITLCSMEEVGKDVKLVMYAKSMGITDMIDVVDRVHSMYRWTADALLNRQPRKRW